MLFRYTRALPHVTLSTALLLLTLSTGCATSGLGGPRTTPPPQAEEVTSQEAYVEHLRRQPQDQLTEEEIAYLEMVAEEKQAGHLQTIQSVMVASVVISLAGAVAAIALTR